MLAAIALGSAILQPTPTLGGFASLPADTFVEGPTSGQQLDRSNGRTPPFYLVQPVHGFSALLPAPGSRALVLGDNGFGTKANSYDFLLCFHSLRMDYRKGSVKVERTFHLSDPRRKMPWAIVAEMDSYPDSPFPVDATLKERRLLTGWDLDPESFRQTSDGTLWFGDEFGPFLVNADVAGRLLRAPIPLPGVFAPENPLICTTPSLGSSRGLAGLAVDSAGRMLYPLLSGPLTSAIDRRSALIYQFDAKLKRFTGKTWSYRMDKEGHVVGDITHVKGMRFLVIECDTGQGLSAHFKKVFMVDLEKGSKREVADLLAIGDPKDLNRDGSLYYSMPFEAIDSLAIRDSKTLIVANDNNYPFSSGRFQGVPDNNEFALIRLPKTLSDY